MTRKQCPVFKNYLQIISPIPFYLWINDSTSEKVYMPANGYTFDCKKLMLKDTMPVQPAYTLWIEYDETLLATGESVQLNASDTNFSDVMQVFGGDVVQLNDAQLTIFRALIGETATETTLQTVAKETTLTTLKNVVENLSSKVNRIVDYQNLLSQIEEDVYYHLEDVYINAEMSQYEQACIIYCVDGTVVYPRQSNAKIKIVMDGAYFKKHGNVLRFFPATTGTFASYYQGTQSNGLQLSTEVRIQLNLYNSMEMFFTIK